MPQSTDPSAFQVKTGLMHVVVRANTTDEAIEVARQQLCLELPRLWDVIQNMPQDRFVVSSVDSNAAGKRDAAGSSDSDGDNTGSDPQHEAA